MNATNFNPYNFQYQGKSLSIQIKKYILEFNFLARTSRGSMQYKPTYFVKVQDLANGKIGIGECSPLKGLSLEYRADYEDKLQYFCEKLADADFYESILSLNSIVAFPSIRFGLEMAVKDLIEGGGKIFFENAFSQGQEPLPINGLVWMGDYDFMLQQMEEKLAAGFTCIKLKIGGIEFDKECELLNRLRKDFSPKKITIRLDANGAFSTESAMQKLETLSKFDVHSIEQPIKQGQVQEMAALCKKTPIPIALDEELIGINQINKKMALLDAIQPQYIILKPSLLGGFQASEEWISLAEERNIDWWITSALESNIGLNAVAQFTANYNVKIPQGLGTGKLYKNNIDSPLEINTGEIKINKNKNWQEVPFDD